MTVLLLFHLTVLSTLLKSGWTFRIDVFIHSDEVVQKKVFTENLLEFFGSSSSSGMTLNWRSVDSWDDFTSIHSNLEGSDLVINALRKPFNALLREGLWTLPHRIPALSLHDCLNSTLQAERLEWCLEYDPAEEAKVAQQILDELSPSLKFGVVTDESSSAQVRRQSLLSHFLTPDQVTSKHELAFDVMVASEGNMEEDFSPLIRNIGQASRKTTTYTSFLSAESPTVKELSKLLFPKFAEGYIWIVCEEAFESLLPENQDEEQDAQETIQEMIPGLLLIRPVFLNRSLEETTRFVDQDVFEAIEVVAHLYEEFKAKNDPEFSVFVRERIQEGTFESSQSSFTITAGKRRPAFSILNSVGERKLANRGTIVDGTRNLDFPNILWTSGTNDKPDGSIFTFRVPTLVWTGIDNFSTSFMATIKQIDEGRIFSDLDLQYKIEAVPVRFTDPRSLEKTAEILTRAEPITTSVIVGDIVSFFIKYTFEYYNSHPEITNPPVILTGLSSAPSLTARSEYPTLIRTCSSAEKQIQAQSYIIQTMGWEQICVLRADDYFAHASYVEFVSSLPNTNVKILNSQNRTIRMADTDDIHTPEVFEMFDELREQRCRISVTFSARLLARVFALYHDWGLWGEGFIQLLSSWIDFFEDGASQEMIEKSKKVLDGGIGPIETGYAGANGDFLKKQLEVSLGKTDLNVWEYYAHDTAVFLATGLMKTIQEGNDPEDPVTLNKVLRGTVLNSLSGEIRFMKDSNDRQTADFHIVNYHNGVVKKIGFYRPNGEVISSFVEQPIWPGGGDEPRSSVQEDHDCPFYKDEEEVNFSDRWPLFICMAAISGAVLPTLSFTWKKWVSRAQFKPLEDVSLLFTFSDLFLILHLVLESIQLIALGPELDAFAQFYSALPKFFSLELEEILNLGDDYFYYLTLSVFGLVTLYFVSALIKFLDLHDMKTKCIPESIVNLMKYYNYLIVMIGYVPIISSSLDVFSCDYVIEVNEEKSYFLSRDCTTKCGSEDHQHLMTFAIFTLVLFVPLATFQRVQFQVIPKQLHIKQRPSFLFSKVALIFSLIIARKLFAFDQRSLAIITFTIMNLFFFLFYSRTLINIGGIDIFQKALLSAVLCAYWIAMFSYFLIDEDMVIFFVLLTAGWISIFVFSLIRSHRLPKILYTGRYRHSAFRELARVFFSREVVSEKMLEIAKEKAKYRDLTFHHEFHPDIAMKKVTRLAYQVGRRNQGMHLRRCKHDF